MRIGTTLLACTLAASGLGLMAQTKAKATEPAKPAKQSLEAQFVRQNLKQVLDSVNNSWFVQPYQNIRSVDLDGNLSINLTAAAVNAKVEKASEGLAKGQVNQPANLNLQVKSTYFANADVLTHLSGEFGNLVYYRVGNRGFIYSKELNAYSTKVDPPPADAPMFFRAWFRQCLNDIQEVYVDGPTFRATMGKDLGNNLQSIHFSAPTGPYDARKREQTIKESLGFWKRGVLEVVFDKATYLPHQMNFRNDAQGVASRMSFTYGPGNRLLSVSVENQSKGMEGPANLTVGYGGNGLMNHIAGQMGFPMGVLKFDMNLTWSSEKKSITTIPPLGATKKGRDELDTMLVVNLAARVLGLQSQGFNFRSPVVGK